MALVVLPGLGRPGAAGTASDATGYVLAALAIAVIGYAIAQPDPGHHAR